MKETIKNFTLLRDRSSTIRPLRFFNQDFSTRISRKYISTISRMQFPSFIFFLFRNRKNNNYKTFPKIIQFTTYLQNHLNTTSLQGYRLFISEIIHYQTKYAKRQNSKIDQKIKGQQQNYSGSIFIPSGQSSIRFFPDYIPGDFLKITQFTTYLENKRKLQNPVHSNFLQGHLQLKYEIIHDRTKETKIQTLPNDQKIIGQHQNYSSTISATPGKSGIIFSPNNIPGIFPKITQFTTYLEYAKYFQNPVHSTPLEGHQQFKSEIIHDRTKETKTSLNYQKIIGQHQNYSGSISGPRLKTGIIFARNSIPGIFPKIVQFTTYLENTKYFQNLVLSTSLQGHQQFKSEIIHDRTKETQTSPIDQKIKEHQQDYSGSISGPRLKTGIIFARNSIPGIFPKITQFTTYLENTKYFQNPVLSTSLQGHPRLRSEIIHDRTKETKTQTSLIDQKINGQLQKYSRSISPPPGQSELIFAESDPMEFNEGMISSMILRKQEFQAEKPTIVNQEIKNRPSEIKETFSKKKVDPQSNLYEMNIIANKIYKLIETRLQIEKERRGIR